MGAKRVLPDWLVVHGRGTGQRSAGITARLQSPLAGGGIHEVGCEALDVTSIADGHVVGATGVDGLHAFHCKAIG